MKIPGNSRFCFERAFAVLTVLVFFSCKGPKNEKKSNINTESTDSLITDIIRQVLKDEISECNFFLEKNLGVYQGFLSAEDSVSLVRMDSVLSRADVDCIMKESRQLNKRFRLTPELVGGHKILPSDSLNKFKGKGAVGFWKSYNEKYGSTSFCIVSRPFFNCDYDYAVVKYQQSCGPLCGYLVELVYMKNGNHWKLIARINEEHA